MRLRSSARLAVDDQRIGPAELRRRPRPGAACIAWRASVAAEVGQRLVVEAGRAVRPGAGRRLPRCDSWLARPLLQRIHEQLLLGHVLGEAGPQERFVGGVLQQPPHQVGHAGQQLAVGRVDADALAQRHQRVLDRVGHAVEHLDLVARAAAGPAARPAARAWARLRTLWLPNAGRSSAWLLQQEPRQLLVVGVGLPLLREDRHRPVLLRGDDRLVIPVRALDQPHPDRRAAPLGPARRALRRSSRGVAQVRLDGDADVGPVAELVLVQDLAEDAQRQVLVGVLLHVDVDERPVLRGRRAGSAAAGRGRPRLVPSGSMGSNWL